MNSDTKPNNKTRPRSPRVDLPTKRRKRFGRPQKPRRDNRKSRYDPDYTADDERHNSQFEAYYRAQRIVPHDEFPTLFSTLAIPLPTSFRVSAHGPYREAVQKSLHGEMAALFHRVSTENTTQSNSVVPPDSVISTSTTPTITTAASSAKSPEESVPIKPLQQLPWYPSGLAWTVSAPRQMLRRDNVLAPFHKFIVNMNNLGAINRQEAVSMVPPLLLDVKKGHAVLDMCAAPGSKTAQIVEALSDAGPYDLSSGGVVVANDSDLKRCWMLAHQLKRFGSPELIITNHEAQFFPKFMVFDRVLCDVPCSGDGTLRKAPDIWRRWNSDMGVALHRLQRQIVERGVDILKPGGRMVYSTCSLNPLENEAIVAHVLRKYGDSVRLIDCSNELPLLKRRSGLTTWRVKNNSSKATAEDGVTTENGEKADDVVTNDGEEGNTSTEKNGVKETSNKEGLSEWFKDFSEVPVRRQQKVVASMFPPSKEEMECGKFNLERCMRLVPHDQDTGGFFVAVLEKNISDSLTKRMQRKLDKFNEDLGKDEDGGEQEVKEKKEDRVVSESVEDEIEAVETGGKVENKDAEGDVNVKEVEDKKQDADGTLNGKGEGNMENGLDGEFGTRVNKVEKKTTRMIADDALVAVGTVSRKTLEGVVNFFGMEGQMGENYLMTRGGDHENFKKIVAVSRTVRTVIRHGVGTRDNEVEQRRRVVRIVNAGVRVMERTDRRESGCGFRLIHDGIGIMRAVMSKRVLDEDVNVEEMVVLLREGRVDVEKRDEERAQSFWKRVLAMGSGSGVIVCEGEEVIVWIGKRNVAVVMTREIVSATLMRLGHADRGAGGKSGEAVAVKAEEKED